MMLLEEGLDVQLDGLMLDHGNHKWDVALVGMRDEIVVNDVGSAKRLISRKTHS